MKIKGVIEDLKNKKNILIKKIIIVKIYLRISLELLWAVWGQFSFRSFLVQLILLKVYRPLPM